MVAAYVLASPVPPTSAAARFAPTAVHLGIVGRIIRKSKPRSPRGTTQRAWTRRRRLLAGPTGLALDQVLLAPLSVMLQHHAWRKNVSGIAIAPLPSGHGQGGLKFAEKIARPMPQFLELVCTAEVR
jgi:hypothetical protein